MVAIKRLILSTFLLFQGIHTFCIYNELSDGSSFKADQMYSVASVGKPFAQHMERDAVACCHYTNRDCSRNSRNDDVVIFRLYLYFMNGSSDARIAKCTTGGALIIRGTQHNYHGECIDVNGVSTMFLLEKEHTYGSPPQTTKST